MAAKKKSKFAVEMRFTGIEIMKSSLTPPTNPEASLLNFNFNIAVEMKADQVNKIVLVNVGVEIQSVDKSESYGYMLTTCVYQIVNFEELIKINAEGLAEMPEELTVMLNSVSISTVRGVMASNYRGTFLHNAILPIIVNPGSMIQNAVKSV